MKAHLADGSAPVPQCYKTVLVSSIPSPPAFSYFLISDPGRIRNVGFSSKTVAGRRDSVLWDRTTHAGRVGAHMPYAICSGAGWTCAHTVMVVLQGPQAWHSLDPECFEDHDPQRVALRPSASASLGSWVGTRNLGSP